MNQSLPANLDFECPNCGSRLEPSAARLDCRACGRSWPLTAGVACFGESAEYPLDLDAVHVAELLALAESAGWQAALHDFLRPLDPALYRRAVDEYRSQWRCLIPRAAGARVLDLRSGWGPIAIGLAEDYGLVVAAEAAYAPGRFTALRTQAMGVDNLQAVSLDPARRLPFPTAFFDVVVLHEVVEWGRPQALLAEVGRVTAPGGWVFANVTNRLNLAVLLRAALGHGPAGHDGEAGVSPAQRETLSGYRRMLARAGFRNQEAYGLLPSAAEPFYAVPLGQRGALGYLLNSLFGDASLRRALSQRHLLGPYRLAAGLWKIAHHLPLEIPLRHCLPGYGLLAQRLPV